MTDSVESVLQKLKDEIWRRFYMSPPSKAEVLEMLRSALEPTLAELKRQLRSENMVAQNEIKRAEAAEQALHEARELIKDYKEANDDKKRLVRELDVAMNGTEGASQQASLCDLIGPAEDMRAENEKLRESLRDLAEQVRLNCSVIRARFMKSLQAAEALSPSPTPAQGCGSPYHKPTTIYCLDCLPTGAPLGALLLSNRKPTEADVKRALEIAVKIGKLEPTEQALSPSPTPPQACPHCGIPLTGMNSNPDECLHRPKPSPDSATPACLNCGKPTDGTWKEAGLKWPLCESCKRAGLNECLQCGAPLTDSKCSVQPWHLAVEAATTGKGEQG